MIDLIVELRGYVTDLPMIKKQPKKEQDKLIERMQEINKEMREFRRVYPLD